MAGSSKPYELSREELLPLLPHLRGTEEQHSGQGTQFTLRPGCDPLVRHARDLLAGVLRDGALDANGDGGPEYGTVALVGALWALDMQSWKDPSSKIARAHTKAKRKELATALSLYTGFLDHIDATDHVLVLQRDELAAIRHQLQEDLALTTHVLDGHERQIERGQGVNRSRARALASEWGILDRLWQLSGCTLQELENMIRASTIAFSIDGQDAEPLGGFVKRYPEAARGTSTPMQERLRSIRRACKPELCELVRKAQQRAARRSESARRLG